MADTVGDVLSQLNESLKEAKNETEKYRATPAGMAVAYSSIVIMALFPIVYGSFKSVTHQRKQKESGEKPETMTRKDAAMFPVIASGALFGLYIFFKLFSKEHINLLLAGYFFLLGIMALAHIMSPSMDRVLRKVLPTKLYQWEYHLSFQACPTSEGENEEIFDYRFNYSDVICWVCCALLGVWYLWKKHWIANNLFGIAFAINGVELLHINTVATGCILLGGLFVYDVFWVFGTDVMVTVAKSFEAPIKLVFPQDFLENGLEGSKFAMLGLGDIVIPGIFIALLLRFDATLNRKTHVYFTSSFIAYIVGLGTTIFIMMYFEHAQPALLYLVPACVGVPLTVALVLGDITAMFKYEDHPAVEAGQKEVEDDVDEKQTIKKTTEPEKRRSPRINSSQDGKKDK
ncbi:minor histocompatibility antigen H13-like [Ornithodoros turicata]|uniref:minor histocompatibility antigen H13-like n=1 Tax=Ornithodoros turicata TaxID=34597 RepID=UPI0031394FF1